MRKTTIDRLLSELNAVRGLSYPAVGYSYYANVAGDGRKRRSIYTIVNAGGGVAYSGLNAHTPRATCQLVRAQLRFEHKRGA